ncbi:MAG: hypothetical protein Q4F71_01490 [Paracoccus sp. (in: a-proteobacteria)]|nr:hypothetical protein [Paracoccus sp. (in: a-proteobacteria)]
MTRIPLFAASCLMAAFLAVPASAQDQVTVPLPDVSGLSQDEAERLIAALAQINVITSNCPGYEITDGEWTLLTGTGDRLAAQLGLDPTTYEQRYYGPAFELLDDPEACERIGPRARPVIEDLVKMGGATE